MELPLPHHIFLKIASGDIPLLGKFIPKINNFGDFGACKPTFLKPQRDNREVWRKGTHLGHPPRA